ncbi:MAG: GAF domain-containing protein, partial [Flavitalea sp.]
AKNIFSYPLLDEIIFRISKYSHSVSNILFAEEEQAIHYFIGEEIVQLFKHLQNVHPELTREIEKYNQTIDSPVKMVYHHRKDYEESITRINNAVARFIDNEQKAAQHVFPHYFERFVTDGVDFNIYIGQSITPHKTFDEFYLKNLKMWQLATLAKAAQLTHRLESELPLPLQTTQLILAHSQPISISFRTAERKFDVDGAYNIRYEILKKRIDKVHIKDSNERLTQPGTIAIVYSQPKEAQEYTEYIEYLQNVGLLKSEIERMDLEDLQGVSGLRGLRVAVNVLGDWNFNETPSLSTAINERVFQ